MSDFVSGWQLLMSYTQQDLRCSKCNRAATGMLSPYCECSGTFEKPIKRGAVQEKLAALDGVAKFYGFSWLEEEVSHYIDVET